MIYFYEKTEQEKARYGHREDSALAHKALLEALRREYAVEAVPEIARREQGKPYFPRASHIHFNYSHCRGGVLCATARGPVGADIETDRTFREDLARYVCHPEELAYLEASEQKDRAFGDIWTAKEAWLKYLGTGIRGGLREINTAPFLEMSRETLGKPVRLADGGVRPGHADAPDEVCALRGRLGNMSFCVFSSDEESLKLIRIERLN